MKASLEWWRGAVVYQIYPQAVIAPEDRRDPFALAMGHEGPLRDGCRTPMVWEHGATQGGFSTCERTWLPVADEHLWLAVDVQLTDTQSLLHTLRVLLAWRRARPGLLQGDVDLLAPHDQVLAFVRDSGGVHGDPWLCAFNMTDPAAALQLPHRAASARLDTDHPLPSGKVHDLQLELPPYGAVFAAR